MHGLPCHPDKSGCGGVHLKASAPAARALIAADLYHHVPKLSAASVISLIDLFVYDHAAAHARAEGDAYRAVNALCAACAKLAVSRCIGVIFYAHPLSERFGYDAFCGEI